MLEFGLQIYNKNSVFYAYVAQQVEHHHGKVGVNGSNPLVGSIFSDRLRSF